MSKVTLHKIQIFNSLAPYSWGAREFIANANIKFPLNSLYVICIIAKFGLLKAFFFWFQPKSWYLHFAKPIFFLLLHGNTEKIQNNHIFWIFHRISCYFIQFFKKCSVEMCRNVVQMRYILYQTAMLSKFIVPRANRAKKQ